MKKTLFSDESSLKLLTLKGDAELVGFKHILTFILLNLVSLMAW